MGRSAWLTWKMHRFEVIAAVILVALMSVSAWIVGTHIHGLGLTDACWPRSEEGGYATPACGQLMERLWPILGSEGTFVRVGLALAASLVGLILGVPVVARELEMRTTGLAWSLQGSRWRWLLARLLPIAAVMVMGCLVLGIAGATFFDALGTARQSLLTAPLHGHHRAGDGGAGR